eukprot:1161837-Pelagomonas_calceolata.AAC.7
MTHTSVNLLIRSEPAPFGSNATVGLSSRSIKRNRVYWSPSCSCTMRQEELQAAPVWAASDPEDTWPFTPAHSPSDDHTSSGRIVQGLYLAHYPAKA